MTDTIAEAFAIRVVNWRASLNADEWFFARLRDELVGSLSPGAAFEAIDGVVSMTLLQDDRTLLAEAVELLLELARRSETTEEPPSLAGGWKSLTDRLSVIGPIGLGLASELARWYRRAGA